jgi:hypothetical protein
LTSERKRSANRTNCRASTGPKSVHGRANSARNALRHGLSAPRKFDAAALEDIEALTREFSKATSNTEIDDLARRVAEAQIDLARVRRARHQFLSRRFDDLPGPDTWIITLKKKKFVPQTLTSFLSDLIKELLAIDRYERRALWHRKHVLRAFVLQGKDVH